MKKITLIVGLPCSGKSVLLKTFDNEKNIIIDDPKDFNNDVLPYLYNDKHVYIADMMLCETENRVACINVLNTYCNGTVDIDFIYFENEPNKCLRNLLHRFEQDDDRKVYNAIGIYTKLYKIPEYVTPLKIWQDEKYTILSSKIDYGQNLEKH